MRRRQPISSALLALGLLLSGNACQSLHSKTPLAVSPAPPAARTEAPVRIQVTSNGWHTDIVLARSAALTRAVPEVADFPRSAYFSFGWGDAAFYQTPDPGALTTLRAAMAPTPAVVHLVGLRRQPGEAFPSAEVLDLQVGAVGYRALLAHISRAFDRKGATRAASVGPGLYGDGLFYPGTGEFHLFNTCNTWTARGLEAAGLLEDGGDVIRAETVMSRLAPP